MSSWIKITDDPATWPPFDRHVILAGTAMVESSSLMGIFSPFLGSSYKSRQPFYIALWVQEIVWIPKLFSYKSGDGGWKEHVKKDMIAILGDKEIPKDFIPDAWRLLDPYEKENVCHEG